MQMLACPYCGKLPKVECFGDGELVLCKPRFGKPHLAVFASETCNAVKAWNDAVKEEWKLSGKKGE